MDFSSNVVQQGANSVTTW